MYAVPMAADNTLSSANTCFGLRTARQHCLFTKYG